MSSYADKVQGVDHVMIGVSDLDRSIAFYEQFGFTEQIRVTVAGDAVALGSGMTDPNGRMALLAHGDFRLELVQAVPDLPSGIARRHPMEVGSSHICFQVTDLPGLYDALREEGVTFRGAPSEFEDYPMRFVYMLDPDGNVVELSEPTGQAAPAETVPV